MEKINKNKNVIFGLSTSKEIAKLVSEKVKIPLGDVTIKHFADGEIFIEVNTSVRSKAAFVIQSTSFPANDNLMELLLFIDAAKRSSVKEINVIIPYFGYARQDKKNFRRQAISAKVIANMLESVGATRIITFDLHTEQIVGFFEIPVDNVKAYKLIAAEIKKLKLRDLTIVSPDHGGVSRARSLASLFNAPLAVIDKRRLSQNEAEAMFILGEVKDRNIIIFDDMVDTGGTVMSAIKILEEHGAKDIYLAISHAVLSSKDGINTAEKLLNAGIKKIITTNSIYHEKMEGIIQIDLSDSIAEVIKQHILKGSITEHFIDK